MTQPPTFLIRDAVEADRPAALVITLDAFAEHRDSLPAEFAAATHEEMVEALQNKGPHTLHVVAEREGSIVGSLLVHAADTALRLLTGREIAFTTPELRLLAVAPNMQRQGIGRALAVEAVHRAQVVGYPYLTLHTSDPMTAATHLAEDLSFARAPQLDFEAAPGLLYRGYIIDFATLTGPLKLAIPVE